MLMSFEPKTFPTERAVPPENAAINATVNSDNEAKKAIRLKSTPVLPSRVIVETLTAFLIARLLS